ncbi:uncharacterized protein TRIADDRAFT_32725 [Trichoplax adhaerens]|uniref:HECT-type E3 ubiquitin transferase n=1 Tax=Trichoplax adhaerens TaxID=10228 RepID=B3SBA4_TRIAD|nr:hypothetical protein TRIADDRAFT_32725 [Trichoplax adhaerens]EDV19966.1 hypothetical protein TRIADDRAFT_32725 [Trichoplax adhaerens]|eukprot:XP_002117556.1 hypothetical protein TRIADDRAFT_32725 [Trichoplax adhaerens]
MSIIIIVYENPQLQSPEYFENVLPRLCQLVRSLSLPAKAELVRFWAKFNESQMLQLVISLQQYLTCTVVNILACSDTDILTSIDISLSNILYNLDMLYLANCLGGITRQSNLAHSEIVTNQASTTANADARSDQVGVFMRTVGGLRRKQDIRHHELQRLLNIDPAICRRPIVTFSAFYNEALSDAIDPRYDYRRFTVNDICLLDFPCVIMPFNKTQYLSLDCRLRQNDEIGAAIILSLLNRDVPNPFLIIRVRRDHLIEDALWQLEHVSDDNPSALLKQLRIKFVGEEGVDDGGLSKEFFVLINQEIFNPEYAMFRYNEKAGTYWFTPDSYETDAQYKLVGILVGLAIYNGIILDVTFPMALYRKLYGQKLILEDLSDCFPEIWQSLVNLLNYEGDVENDFMYTFKISYTNVFGDAVTVDLVENGGEISVNKNNREEFIRLYTEFLLTNSVKNQFDAFKKGFNMVTEDSLLKYLFRPDEVDMLVCGSKCLDFHELERVTYYDGGLTKDSTLVKDLWEVVHSFDEESKRKFLKFTTGSDRVPVGGLSKIMFRVIKNGDDSTRLPTSHTCFNVLMLCNYSSKAKLKERLLYAINNGNAGFGLS